MNKVFTICKKDLLITLNDTPALIFMLLAPFLLTLALGAVTGSFNRQPSGGGGLSEIPVVIVNQDEGQMGAFISEAFDSSELATLFDASQSTDLEAARQLVTDDSVAAAVIVPAGFSASILPDQATGATGAAAPIEIYTSPSRPISGGVVRSVVVEIVNRLEAGPVSGEVAIGQLLASGRLDISEIAAYAGEMAPRLAAEAEGELPVTLNVAAGAETPDFNPLSYLAPGMALLFLMYTVTQGGRSILTERDMGTLPRMLATPTSTAQVLGGKLLSIVVTGFLQVGVLVFGSTLLFGLKWGDPLAVTLLIAAAAIGATGWGILLASFARHPWQVASIGTALMLFFGLLGGSFISLDSFSGTVRLLSKITPNAWALEGFTTLGSGGTLADVVTPILALLAMGVILFIVAVLSSRRRWASGFVK